VVSEPKVGKSGISLGSHSDGLPVNVSGRSHGLCVAGELELEPRKTSSRRSHGLHVMEELVPMCDGKDC
jgi:hypothetical protein